MSFKIILIFEMQRDEFTLKDVIILGQILFGCEAAPVSLFEMGPWKMGGDGFAKESVF